MKTTSRHLVFRAFSILAVAVLALLTLPVIGQAQNQVKFMVVGDTRGTGTADQINTAVLQELAAQIQVQAPAFVLVPGDLVYSGTLAAFQSWKTLMQPMTMPKNPSSQTSVAGTRKALHSGCCKMTTPAIMTRMPLKSFHPHWR